MQNPLSNATQYITTLAIRFWQQEGTLQTYLDFLLSEIDPMLSRKRNVAEVIQIIDETADTKTFVLRPSSRWQGFVAGQYINVETEINGVMIRRNYSISCAPKLFREQQLISITVKKIEGGRASTHLHERLIVGDTLTIGLASGDFTLQQPISTQPPAKPLFIAAGSGITPIMSMIKQIKEETPEQSISLIYYVNNPQALIFESQLQTLSKSMPNFSFYPHFTESEGYITSQQLQLDCPDIAERTLYLCGPQGFMKSASAHCLDLGLAPERMHQESFGSYVPANFQPGTAGQIRFLNSGKYIESNGKKTVLELAESAGLNPKYGCRSGICHECKCTKSTGQVLNRLTGELIPDDQTHIQACISIPVGDLSIESL
ncbi:ferredoxin reductase [Alkalimarinus sediminis]|uniref:FAD-binding oxidoreductase n=1 Tax=Alkalimarinus sediminis TaxID=1632866 RepID=A0A9E8KQ60_9ALTE|nr:ferredoxin reductase [Alkalimarinus sediminis]UZW74302.1 FAD-binding oxidoreductase [Alkalimarinus sediminis]